MPINSLNMLDKVNIYIGRRFIERENNSRGSVDKTTGLHNFRYEFLYLLSELYINFFKHIA